MNPLLILIPLGALIFGPRVWVRRITRRHDQEDADLLTGAELARALLDRHRLHGVKVEVTDVGDHYDPDAKAVRLSRDRFERRTLTAVTTAAHEVAHALQDAEGYLPFVLRTHLAVLARLAGQTGSAVLIAVPAISLAGHQRIPPSVIGTAVFAMLGTGMAVQVVALPTELDASFHRALPMLQRGGYIRADQVRDAHRILFVSSLTYVASSLLTVLSIWPWIGRPPLRVHAAPLFGLALTDTGTAFRQGSVPGPQALPRTGARGARQAKEIHRGTRAVMRLIAKPLVRAWLSRRGAART